MIDKKHYLVLNLISVLVAIIAIVMAILTVNAYRSGELHFVTTIKDFETASYIAVIAFVLSVVSLLVSNKVATRQIVMVGLLGLILSLPQTLFIANFEYAARAYPAINDITTDTEDPPGFWDVPNPVTYPGDHVAALQKKAYPDLMPILITMEIDQAFKAASDVAKLMGWEIIAENTDDMQIEAVETSPIFGFKDNIVIRLQENENKTRIDVRSHSRLGKIDRGVNAKRIRKYLKKLDKQLSFENS